MVVQLSRSFFIYRFPGSLEIFPTCLKSAALCFRNICIPVSPSGECDALMIVKKQCVNDGDADDGVETEKNNARFPFWLEGQNVANTFPVGIHSLHS